MLATTSETVSVMGLIPEQLKAELMFYRDNLSESKWGIGDRACDLVIEMPNIKKPLLDQAVGMLVGLSDKTIADYRATCDFFPDGYCWKCQTALVKILEKDEKASWCRTCKGYTSSAREYFGVHCSFSHFKTVKSCDDYATAIQWLERVVSSADDYSGHVMPIEKLRAMMADAGEDHTEVIWKRRVKGWYTSMAKASNSLEWPPAYRQAVSDAVDAFEAALGKDPEKWGDL